MTSVLKFSKAHWSKYRCEYHAFDRRQWLIWKPTLIEGSVYVEHPLLLDSHLKGGATRDSLPLENLFDLHL